MMIDKKQESGGHETNGYNIFNNGCIDIASKPLKRVTYDELILKIAHLEVMLIASFHHYKLAKNLFGALSMQAACSICASVSCLLPK